MPSVAFPVPKGTEINVCRGSVKWGKLVWALLPVFLTGCAARQPPPPAARPGLVRARLVAGDSALTGARLIAVREPGVSFREEIFEAESGTDGYASLRLDAGTYYIKGHSNDGSVFGWYGPNPLQVREGEEVAVAVRGMTGNRAPAVSPAVGPDGLEGVEGVVISEEGPLAGAMVAFYLDASNQFRGPAYLEVESDGEGRFETSLSSGRYFVVVRKRNGPGGRFGPLATGDHFGYYAFNPIVVRSKEQLSLRVGAVEVLRRSGWTEPSLLRTRLTGVVHDGEGRPLAGYQVFLHTREEMLGRAEFVSEEKSGDDGSWVLWAERAGRYYLGARRTVGQAREEGEEIGFYAGPAGHAVDVAIDGREIDGLDIVVDLNGGMRKAP